MNKANIYTARGIKKAAFTLPKSFSQEENLALLAQAVRVYEDRLHPGLAKVKTRADVDRTKKKLYRQKGTGGARHGARSAPIFVGGGVAHGPKGVKRILSLPTNMKRKALWVALSLKAKEGEITLVEGLSTLKKTKEAQSLIAKIAKNEGKEKRISKYTFVLSDLNLGAAKVLGNIDGANVVPYKSLNAYLAYLGGMLVFDKEIFAGKTQKL